MAKQRKVYDVTTDTLYDSIASAAKALNVDASNLRKVINGSRPSIGGHNFIAAGNMSSRQLKSSGKKLVASLSEQQLKRQAKARSNNIIDLQNDVYKLIRTANGRLDTLRKGYGNYKLNVLAHSNVAKDVLRLTETLGKNKSGLLNGSKTNIAKLNIAQLKQVKSALEAQLNRRTFLDKKTAYGLAYAEANRIANIFGVQTGQLVKYSNILPLAWEVLDSTQSYGLSSDEILAQIADLMDRGKSANYIKNFLDTYKAYGQSANDTYKLFAIAKTKWGWIQGDKELEDDVIKLIKLQQLYPHSQELQDTVNNISQVLKSTRSVNAFRKISKKIDQQIVQGIFAGEVELNTSFDDDLDSIITYSNVLEML